MPTAEPLLIIVDGKPITDSVPKDSVEIVEEIGKRVSTARFTVEAGAAFNLARWQTVLIYSEDMSTLHFGGFVMDLPTKRSGISVDYDLTCSSVEVLLQYAIIDGTFTGTDDEIIAAMLANAYPDLSDWFDWASDITPISLSDLTIDFQDMSLLDGLDKLSTQLGGVAFNQNNNDSLRLNINRNPALTNDMTDYGGALIEYSSHYISDFGTWVAGNTTWGAGFGETGGGIKSVSLVGTGGVHVCYFRAGRSTDGDPINQVYHIERGANRWLGLRFRLYYEGDDTSNSVQVIAVSYDDDGNFYNDQARLVNAFAIDTWSDWSRAWDLSDPEYFPASGWVEFSVKTSAGAGDAQFNLFVDDFLVETLYGESEPTVGTYFDGETANSRWIGVANASHSQTGDAALEWGTSPNAAFDVDIDSGTEIFDEFSIDYAGLGSLSSIIVSGTTWEDVTWIYPNNGNAVSTHFDLEIPIYPPDTLSQPLIYTNIGSDGTPNWSSKTVATRQDGFAAGDVLYDLEDHWLEFQDPPPDLELSFRVIGRIKKNSRTTVSNDTLINETGVNPTDVIILPNTTTTSEAYDIGQAQLDAHEPKAIVKFYTYEPGLKAGAELDIDDNTQGFSETLIIQRVTKKYLGGGILRAYIEAGALREDLGDIIYGNNQRAEDNLPVASDVTSLTVSELVDADANTLLDADGNTLLEVY